MHRTWFEGASESDPQVEDDAHPKQNLPITSGPTETEVVKGTAKSS